MKQGNHRMYAAKVTITGEGHSISGGTLIGCAPRQGHTRNYGYVLNGQPYIVTGTPETTWSVTINGASYSFSAADQGKTWTAETVEVAVLSITIYGVASGESPGYLIYWPVAADPSGYIDPPTSGSTGVYHDANEHFHAVEFRTTWSVPDLQTVFTWNRTEPFGGPYTALKTNSPGYGDGDTWESGDPSPGQDPDTGDAA